MITPFAWVEIWTIPLVMLFTWQSKTFLVQRKQLPQTSLFFNWSSPIRNDGGMYQFSILRHQYCRRRNLESDSSFRFVRNWIKYCCIWIPSKWIFQLEFPHLLVEVCHSISQDKYYQDVEPISTTGIGTGATHFISRESDNQHIKGIAVNRPGVMVTLEER